MFIKNNKLFELSYKLYCSTQDNPEDFLINLDDIYKWINATGSNLTIPHSRRPFTSKELEDIDTMYRTTNNLPAAIKITDEVKKILIDMLYKEYEFNSRPCDMSESQYMVVTIVKEMEAKRRGILNIYPELNSQKVINDVLHQRPELLWHLRNWINKLPV